MTLRTDGSVRELPPFWARIVKYGIAVVTAIFYVTAVLQFDYTPDASYVSFRVASRFVEGGGFSFGDGQAAVGSGGPIWTLILGAGLWGGLDASLVAKTFDLVFACLSLFGVYFLAALVLRDKLAAFFAALLFSVDPWVLRGSASGMGDSLALLVSLGTLWYGFRREYPLASFLSGVLILCAPLEGIVLWAVIMVDASAVWRRRPGAMRSFAGSTAMALLSAGPWLVYAAVRGVPAFGSLPIATFAGTPFDGPSGEGPAQVLLWRAVSGGLLLAVLIAGHVVAVRRSDWKLLAPSSFPLMWAVVVMVVHVVVSPGDVSRTWILISPVLAMYGILGLYYLSLFVIGVGRRSLSALLIMVVAVLCVSQGVYRLKVLPEMQRTVLEMQQEVRPLAHWIKARVETTDRIVAPFGGLIGWVTGAEIRTDPFLWGADAASGVEFREGVMRDSVLLVDDPRQVVVDRSSDGTRLAGLGLEPVRSWGAGGGASHFAGMAYTAYVVPSRAESFLEGPGHSSEGKVSP